MNIGILGYFNPYEVKEFFPKEIEVPNINIMASSVNATVRGLLQEGHYVRVFTSTPFKNTTKCLKGDGIEIHLISTSCAIKGGAYFSRIFMVGRLKRVLAHNIQGLDVLHAQWTYEFALAAKQFSNKLPVFCSVRDWAPYIYSISKGIKERLYWYISLRIFYKVMKGDDLHFIANSEYTLSQIKSLYPQKEITIIPNPIMKEKILDKKKQRNDQQIFISIAQSLDEPRKNIFMLLKAFKEYCRQRTKSKLILVGHYSQEIYQYWKSLNLLNNVTLTGEINRKECFELLDKSTVLIHPSTEETFGNILLEGMARCLPCIGGESSGAVPKVLGYGKYGILCNINNVDSIVDAMLKTNEIHYVNELTNLCTMYLKNNFQNNIIAQKHIELYELYIKRYIYNKRQSINLNKTSTNFII